MITIDGYTWPVPCDIQRTAEMTASEISGMMLDKSYFNDVLGTFMRYDISLAVPPAMSNDYATLYETLTKPIDGHDFILPHGQDSIEINGRVESVQDTLVYTVSHRQLWKGISFSIIANHPSRVETLEGAISRGRSELPPQSGIKLGSVYILTEDGWYPYKDTSYTDADEVYY